MGHLTTASENNGFFPPRNNVFEKYSGSDNLNRKNHKQVLHPFALGEWGILWRVIKEKGEMGQEIPTASSVFTPGYCEEPDKFPFPSHKALTYKTLWWNKFSP